MAEKKNDQAIPSSEDTGGGGTATAKPKKSPKKSPKKKPPGFLPPWKVLLHNDDKNSVEFVIVSLVELTPLNKQEAEERTKEADDTGVALVSGYAQGASRAVPGTAAVEGFGRHDRAGRAGVSLSRRISNR